MLVGMTIYIIHGDGDGVSRVYVLQRKARQYQNANPIEQVYTLKAERSIAQNESPGSFVDLEHIMTCGTKSLAGSIQRQRSTLTNIRIP